MNYREYLLTLLAEECAEVQKLCTKSLRFGLEDTEPNDHTPNSENLIHELCDVMAIVELMYEDEMLTPLDNDIAEEMIDSKKVRTKQWMNYSRNRGNLCD